jgi:hypothetical protein
MKDEEANGDFSTVIRINHAKTDAEVADTLMELHGWATYHLKPWAVNILTVAAERLKSRHNAAGSVEAKPHE